jgi:hypothetical protein
MIGFIIGFVLGSWFGVAIAAALVMSRNYDRRHKDCDSEAISGEGWETDLA